MLWVLPGALTHIVGCAAHSCTQCSRWGLHTTVRLHQCEIQWEHHPFRPSGWLCLVHPILGQLMPLFLWTPAAQLQCIQRSWLATRWVTEACVHTPCEVPPWCRSTCGSAETAPCRCSSRGTCQVHCIHDILQLWASTFSPIFPLTAECTVCFQSNCRKMCKPVCSRLECGLWPLWAPA